MPKKSAKKQKAVWGWAMSNSPGKPSETEKAKVSGAFAPWIAQVNADMPPLDEPQEFNQMTNVFSKWRGSYFYIMATYKCPDRPEYVIKGFETGIARLTYKSPDRYDLAAFHYTDKWWPIMFDLTLEQAFEGVRDSPIFNFL